MNETIEVSAKDVAQAIELGLARLSTTIDQVEVKVLSHGGFFKSAKILIAKGKIADPKTMSVNVHGRSQDNKEQGKSAGTEFFRSQTNISSTSQPQKQNQTHGWQNATHSANTQQRPQHQQKVGTDANDRSNNQQQKPAGASFANPKNNVAAVSGRLQTNNPAITPNPKPTSVHQQNQPLIPKQKPVATLENAKKIADYIQGIITKMGIIGEVIFKLSEDVELEIKSQDAMAIGYKGETLASLELLANAFAGDGASVVIDALGYRQKRIEILKSVADKTAEKAIRIGKKVFLEPMDNRERKIIHTHLENNPKVISKSEGNEGNRRVVVFPKK